MSLGNLFLCLTALMEKKVFVIYRLNLLLTTYTHFLAPPTIYHYEKPDYLPGDILAGTGRQLLNPLSSLL